MDPELRGYLDENRRHFDVVAEQMTARVQLVAEGVTGLAERLDRVERNLREEILGVQRELSAMIREPPAVVVDRPRRGWRLERGTRPVVLLARKALALLDS
jgi:hypothetical protein